MAKAVAMLVALALVVVVAMSAGGASAKCDPAPLAVCVPAMMNGSPPTAPCCSNLRAQESCFCEYMHDPKFRKYVNSPNTRKTLTSCGIAFPSC